MIRARASAGRHNAAPSKGATAARNGAPLAPRLRQDLEPALGADFSEVRIHADREAGESALALGARAYSIGSDVVFAPGHFAPETAAGRELLAHELVHVRQDAGRAQPGADEIAVDRPDSPQEREAETTARAVASAAPGHSAPMPTRQAAPGSAAGPVLHRSLLGSGIGALIGGVGLGVVGGLLLGPVGAVIGGIVGAVGGAILGDLATRQSRSLTPDEKAYLREIFHDSVDYDKVTITRGSALSAGAARTTGNTINLQDHHFRGDTMELTPAGTLVLAHEMGHVWQYQNGGLAYIPSSLIPQLVAALQGGDRNAAYNWRDAARNRIPWYDWNAEQQAECISDWNEAFRRIEAGTATLEDYDTVALAQPFIEMVRQRIGAPGSSRRRREDAAPAGATP